MPSFAFKIGGKYMIYKLKHHSGETKCFQTGEAIDTIIWALEIAIFSVPETYGDTAVLSNEELIQVLKQICFIEEVKTEKQLFGVEIDMADLWEANCSQADQILLRKESSTMAKLVSLAACAIYEE